MPNDHSYCWMNKTFEYLNIIENATITAAQVQTQNSENSSGYSLAVHIFLPMAGLAILWRRWDLFSRLLLHVDRSYVSVLCPSFSKREKLLRWTSARLPLTWSSQSKTLSSGIVEVWRDGSLLCTLINTAIPGACQNPHRHFKKPPLHGQALAYKYLGVIPMFTDEDLNGDFSANQERNFIHYLHLVQQAIIALSLRDENCLKFSSQYIARGMGIFSGEQHHKNSFYIYSNTTVPCQNSIIVHIRGPYGTEGSATVPAFQNLNSHSLVNILQRQFENSQIKVCQTKANRSFLQTISLDLTSYINAEKPSSPNDIPIHVDMEISRAKITYIPKNNGMYEINIISNVYISGELIRGSPYNVHINCNESGEEESFESTKDIIEEVPVIKKRRILSKTIDFIDKKIDILNYLKNHREMSDIEIIKALPIIENPELGNLDQIIENNAASVKNELGHKPNKVPSIIFEHECEENSDEENFIEVDDEMIVEENNQPIKDLISTNLNNVSFEEKCKLMENVYPNVNEVDEKIVVNENNKAIEDPIPTNLNNMSYEEKRKLIENEYPSAIEASKMLKDLVNTSNKQSFIANHDQTNDLNNNLNEVNVNADPFSTEVDSGFPTQNNPDPDLATIPTSPICPDHIAPEVPLFQDLPLKEKRMVFATQYQSVQTNSTENSTSLSDQESDGENSSSSLKVLNVLNVLKECNKCKSVPDVNSPWSTSNSSAESNFKEIFNKKKEFWCNKLSASTLSLSNVEDYSSKQHSLSPIKENRPFGKLNGSHDYAKSVDNIFMSFSRRDSFSKYVSMDNDLSNIMSLEDRKKILLKDQYQNEIKNRRSSLTKTVSTSSLARRKDMAASISNLVEKFNSNDIQEKAFSTDQEKTQKLKNSTQSQFKRAIRFFKNLEKSTNKKLKQAQNGIKLNRRRSLEEYSKAKRKLRPRFGSLPFSFEKILNIKAIKEDSTELNCNQKIFVNKLSFFKSRIKNRKSIKSVFNVE